MLQNSNNMHENVFRFLQFFIAGFAGLAYQIVSFKLISSSGIGDAISVAISLTAFVSLSGLGSLIGGKLSHTFTGWLEIAVGSYAAVFFGLLMFIGIDSLTTISGMFSLEVKLVMFLLIISPLSIISGMLIPLHQERLPKSEENSDFLRFFFVYVLFHIGGGLSLILIDLYGFRNIGWIQVGFILGIISLLNGISITKTKTIYTPLGSDINQYKKNNTKLLLIGLFALSIITGYVGIISYKLFDYLVETNIRNYTVVTAFVFFGLTLSALISNKIKLSFRGVLGATSLGILSIFISPIIIPPLSNIFITEGINTWWIYVIAGSVLIIPLYALIGTSIPSIIRLGVKSSYALCIASIGNAIGYWLFILTAHYNVDTYVLLGFVFVLGILSTRFFILSVLILGTLLYHPVSKSFHNASHQIFLHNYIVHEKRMLDTFWNNVYNNSNSMPFEYDVNIINSWNTYGWSTDHIEVVEYSKDGEEREEYYILSGIKSLSLLPPEITMYDESMVATIPAFFVEDKNKALVLGSGTGISANLVAKNFNVTDVVDISPDTTAILEHFSYMNGNVLDDINLIKQDALSFILNNQEDENKYNYIFSTVTGAGYPMSSMLYTKEFFKSSANILSEDGVFSFWVDRRFGIKNGFPGIMASLKEAFPYIKRYTILPQDISMVLSDTFIPYQVIVASKSPLGLANSNKELFDFIKDKQMKLQEVNGESSDKLLSASDILNKRHIEEPLNISTDTQPSGINSMEYSYNYLIRYESLENLVNNTEIHKKRIMNENNETYIEEGNYNKAISKPSQKAESNEEPFDFSPDAPLDPDFDPGPDFDSDIEG